MFEGIQLVNTTLTHSRRPLLLYFGGILRFTALRIARTRDQPEDFT